MTSAADLLAKTDAAIEGLLNAMADDATQEYTVQGKTWKRADFAMCLGQLRLFRTELQKEAGLRSNGLRLVTVGRPGVTG